MEELQRLQSSRKAYKSHVTRTFKRVEELMATETIDQFQLTALMTASEQLQKRKETIAQLDTRIVELITTPEGLEEAILETEETQDRILEKINHIGKFLELKTKSTTPSTPAVTLPVAPRPDTVSTNPETHPHGTISTTDATSTLPTITTAHSDSPIVSLQPPNVNRLPKLTLPIFSGDPLTWQSFWDSFDAAVHSNPTLNPVQKFNYLRSQLQGDAARTIAGLPLTEPNYGQSISLLKERFGQPQKLINAHIQALLDLPSPTNDLPSLRLFYDLVENHIRGLSSLGVPKVSYGTLLVPIIFGKLSVPTRRNLAREHSDLEWTIDEVQAAVLKEIRVFESGLYNNDPSSYTSVPRTPPATASFHTAVKGGRNTTPSSGKKKSLCIYCKGEHSPNVCTVVTDCQKRLDIVKRENLCFNCLGKHKISQCNSKFRCKRCNHKHHTSLCKPANGDNSKPDTQSTDTRPPVQSNSTATPVLHGTCPSKDYSAPKTLSLLKTAIAPISAKGLQIQGNILFDEGSQRSFITKDTANKLNLRPTKTEQVAIAPFGAEHTSLQPTAVGHINVETESGSKIPISVLIVPFIAVPLQNALHATIDSYPHLHGLKLAHPITNEDDFQISVLIGADYYWTFVEDKIVRGDGPTAQQSKLGYLLSGPVSSPLSQSNATSSLHVATMSITTTEESNLDRFWLIEEAGTTQTSPKKQDIAFIQHYQTTCISQATDGTYTAKFPWKPDHPPLPSNFEICQKRTRHLIARLAESPVTFQLYNNIITDQEARGFIEKVPPNCQSTNAHYLPHHPVKKDSTTTPIRIVYDCSCRQSKTQASLNDCLLVGPPFLNDLCSIILRFRNHTFAFATDIEKAFLHVKLHESDQDSARFLWISDLANPSGDLLIYRFKVVPFGTSSSPFMLNATLDLHLKKFSSPVAEDMKANFYVDNLISGCDSEQQAINYYEQSRSIMCKANFNLRSWSTNSPKLHVITKEQKTNDPNTCVNLLGLRWNTMNDTLCLTSKSFPSLTSSSLVTKREILSESAQIYDPLGLLTPITVKAKLLLQTLWRKKVDWDEPLDQEIRDQWVNIATDIQEGNNTVYPRRYFTRYTHPTINRQLHIFADASLCAYGAVAYLIQDDQVTLVMSRSRVAPVKPITLPKLELMAAVIATRLAKFVMQSLYLKSSESDTSVYLWSDSQITLHWIYDVNHSSASKPFVANRVAEITESFPATAWTYVPTSNNPADLLTRGISAQQLKSSELWAHGPPWLTSKDQWPTWSPTSVLNLLNIDVDSPSTETASIRNPPQQPGVHLAIDASHYSTLKKLLIVTTHVLRFYHNLKHQYQKVTGPITAKEMSNSKLLWIKNTQQLAYQDDIDNLHSRSPKRTLLVRQLRLFLDDKGFLRCGGRIHNAPISELTKFPYLLSPKHQFTKLLVYATHEKLHHAGLNSTVTALRQEYWIPAIRMYVKKLLRKCVICTKLTGRPYRAPDPPPLPKARITDPTPFSVCGVDFTGALYVRERETERKVYICLFTCATTRAVHLEIVLDMTVENFMLAFRKFASRRSTPRKMISDNASTYLSAANELQQLFNSPPLKQALEYHGVTWQFIPKRAPWYGGFWERLIGLTKQALKKTLGRTFVTLPVLEAIIVEIEASLNDRPLTYVSAEVGDIEPLTPAHLLYGRRITSLPHLHDGDPDDPDYNVSAPTMRKQLTNHTRLLQSFQSRWRREYLTALRDFHKTTGINTQRIRKGEVILIHDDGPRIHWRLGVVESLITGNDGLVRAANVRTSTNITSRPITKLYPLEVSAPTELMTTSTELETGNTIDDDNVCLPRDTEPVRPLKRAAARRAVSRLSEWTRELCCPPEDVKN